MPAVDFAEIAMEESPRYDGAASTTPYRISTDKLHLPVRGVRLGPAPSHLSRADELRGIKAEPPRLIETYDPDGSLSVRGYLKDLVWLFELAGWVGTFTAGDGIITDPDAATIPTGASRWVFTKRDAIVAQTAQVKLNFKDENLQLLGQGYAVSSLAIPASGEVSADLMGMVLKRNAVDTTTVPVYSSSAIPPIRRGDLFLTWLASSGRSSDFSLAFSNPLERVRTLSIDPPTSFPDVIEHGDEWPSVTGSIPKRVLAAADIDALLAASTFAAKARWKTPKVIGATAYKYTMWVEMPACQLVEGNPEDLGNKRRVGADFSFVATHDEASGFDAKITIVNDVTAIKTFA